MSVSVLWDKFKGFLDGGVDPGDHGDWDEQDDGSGYGVPHVDYGSSRVDKPPRGSFRDEYYDEEEIDISGPKATPDRNKKRKGSNVYDLVNKQDAPEFVTVMISAPKVMEDATYVCDYLRENKICIVNMHGMEHHTAQRIADYLGGVSYALNGHVERIDSHIFVMAPSTAQISKDLKDEIKAGSFITKAFK